ncbi:Zn-finger-containing protein [Pseudoloma neurophilia]|uniref:Zn-finger-containing protein n=1 Tax=Pseudoloma neurophilia TaxID=146866 RepID=A0A0R0LUL5_9MICR|nr:Zn-finger-containing protein [Pseudoloma neurophilia]
MKEDNTLNLNEFLQLNQSEFNSDFETIDDFETYLLNQSNYNQDQYQFDYNFTPENLEVKTDESQSENYRPKFIRGKGVNREGYCQMCSKWFRLKTSSYWYHMNYKHGINSKGKKYPEPILKQNDQKIESYCTICKKWIVCTIKGRKSIHYSWFKHFQKKHGDQERFE